MIDKFKHSLFRATKIAAAVSVAMMANPANAQLEEIIVTASKRAESTQTSALSITAISSEDIKASGAVDFFDFAPSIPNLSFGAATDGVLSGRSLSIRGIQGANTTGVYIDDTPINESIDPRVLELERIEVLRGPQGTLYGARSLGGTIRYITKKADIDQAYGSVRSGISSTDESDGFNFIVSGNYNVPLGDNAALLASGLYESQKGVFDRAVGTISHHADAPATLAGAPVLVNEDVDDRDTVAFQVSLLLTPSDTLTIEPRVMYQKVDLDGFPLADIDTENFVQNRDFNTPEGGEDEWALLALNVNYETNYGTFTSATSYFDQYVFETEGTGSFINFLQAIPLEDFLNSGDEIEDPLGAALIGAGIDADATSLFDVVGVNPVASPIFQEQNFETIVQEFRFVSDFDGSYNFVVGAFYQDTTDREAFQPRNFATGIRDNLQALVDTQNFAFAVEDFYPFGDLIFTSDRPTDIEELGLFGEVTFDINERLALLIGARWFDTEVVFSERQAGLPTGTSLANDQPLSTIPVTTGTQQEDGVNLKASIEYAATSDLFFYGSVAEGFRLGGGNGTIPDALGCPQDLEDLGLTGLNTSSFDSDDLISYEVGVKTDVSDSTRINATAFLIDFEGIQQAVQLECGFQFVGNFGSARSQGIELEILSQPSENLTLGLNIGYTDAEFTETVLDGSIATDGDPLQFVPKFTVSAHADYTVPAAFRDMDFFTRADISYADDSISRVNSTVRERNAYEQVSLRFGLRDEKYAFTFYIRNLTDDIANLADNRSLAAETPGRPRFVVSRPRTIWC